jgi:spore coat polysaccharide biosynthesis predicted glycosyltransferase SpsG
VEFYATLKKKCRRLIVLDDYARIPYQADLVINPNVYFDPSQYSETLGEVVGGGDYAIVRPEFRAARPYQVKKELKKILIMAGGSDYRQLLPMMVREIMPQFQEVDFQIVSGSDESKSALEADARLYENCQVFARLDAASLAQLMVQADLAITTCGQTTIELSVIGTPMIGICIDLDQELYRNFYTAQKLFLSTLNWDDPELKEKISVDIDRMRSESMRAAISSKLKKLIDGKGAKRIAQKVIND